MNTKATNWRQIFGIVLLCLLGVNMILSFFAAEVSHFAYVCACVAEFFFATSYVLSNWNE